jgi:hypothetical protein
MRPIYPLRIWILLAGLFTLAPSIFAQVDITLRFIDAGSGKPIAGISIAVFAWDENEGRQKPQPSGILRIDKNSQVIRVDKEGKAVFHLYDEPALKTLFIDPAGDLRGCSVYRFSIEEVLRAGVVASYHAGQPKWCVALKAQATSKPREIVIFDKRMTVLDRMRQEIP